jgi:tRNA-uridine 2-sulfurtransferase
VYALEVDVDAAVVVVGNDDDLLVGELVLTDLTWSDQALTGGARVRLQTSAHGRPLAASYDGDAGFAWDEPARRVAPGQTVAIYDGDRVVGAGIAR